MTYRFYLIKRDFLRLLKFDSWYADIVIGGLTAEPKNLKTPFFSRYSNFLLIEDWKWSKTYPVFLFMSLLTQKFWPSLNQHARNGPFQAKFGTPLATIFVVIL